MVLVWKRRDRTLRRDVVAAQNHDGADLTRARLMAMDLRGKHFVGANMEWADLSESDLTDAVLRGANLHGAFLTGARLTGADLTAACLDETMLFAANFESATLTDAQFEGAIWDPSTVWPVGFTPPTTAVGAWRGRRRYVPHWPS